MHRLRNSFSADVDVERNNGHRDRMGKTFAVCRCAYLARTTKLEPCLAVSNDEWVIWALDEGIDGSQAKRARAH